MPAARCIFLLRALFRFFFFIFHLFDFRHAPCHAAFCAPFLFFIMRARLYFSPLFFTCFFIYYTAFHAAMPPLPLAPCHDIFCRRALIHAADATPYIKRCYDACRCRRFSSLCAMRRRYDTMTERRSACRRRWLRLIWRYYASSLHMRHAALTYVGAPGCCRDTMLPCHATPLPLRAAIFT